MKIKKCINLICRFFIISTAVFSEDFNKAQHNGKIGERHGLNGVEAQG